MGQEHGPPWPSTCVLLVFLWLGHVFHFTFAIWWSRGCMEELMDSYGKSWNYRFYSLPFDMLVFLASILFFVFCILTQLSLWGLYLWLPSCCYFLSCGLLPEWPGFLFTVATVLFQTCVDLWTRAHCPPYFLLPGLSVPLLPAPGRDQALPFPVSPVSTL